MPSRVRIIWLSAIALVPLVLFSVLAIRNNTSTHEARIVADRVSLAKAQAQAVVAFVEGNLSTVRALSLSPVVGQADHGGTVPPFLALVAADNADWEGIGLIGPDGYTLTGSTSTSGTVNLSDRPYFQQAAAGEIVVSDPIVGRIRGVVTVVLGAPVEFGSGQRGALVVPLSLSRLTDELRGLDGGTGTRVILVDSQARAFVHPDENLARDLVSIVGAPEVDAVRRGETGTRVTRSADGTELLAAYTPVGAYGWSVLTYEPTDRAFAPVRSALFGQVGLLALAIIVVGALAWVLGGRLVDSYQATIRARMQAEEARQTAEQAASRAEFLAQLSQELAGSLDYESTFGRVAHLAVPTIADWCAVHVVDEARTIRPVAVAHVDPEKVELAQTLERQYPPDPNAGVPLVIATGEPLLFSEIPDSLLVQSARDPEHLELIRSLELHSVMVVPMIARDHILGALTFVVSNRRPAYGESDMRFAQDAAARAALALDNARLHRDLQRAIHTRDEFFAAISHDLRNPLTAIRGAAQLLSRNLSRLNGDEATPFRSPVSILDSASSRMSRLIAGLLDLARLEMGRSLDLERASTDLVALTRRVVAEAQQATDRQQIRLDAADDVVGHWDAGRLERVVANLLDNAIKYSGDGVEIAVGVARSERDGTPSAVLTVRDQGLGIPATDVPHVFDQFRRGSNVGSVSGTGLGLAGARQIVEEHNGWISIDSEVGTGTTVTIELPLEPVPTRVADPAPA